jgi:antitoxin PrlF
MATATVTSKGQTVIPKPVRDYLGLQPGDRVDYIIQEDQTVLLKPATQDITQLKGFLYKSGRKPVSVEAMQKAIRNRGRQP